MNKFVSKFKKDFSFVSCISTRIFLRNAWYVDSGAPRDMTSSQKLFPSLTKKDLGVHVNLGDDAKYLVGVNLYAKL